MALYERGFRKRGFGLVSKLRPAAPRQHHFLYANAGIRYGANPNRDNDYYQPDLLHRTVEGQRVEAEALLDALLAPPSSYAPRSRRPRPLAAPTNSQQL